MTTELLNTVSSSFDTVSGFALSALNVVLPIALGIFAILFVWILIKKFFIRMSGGGNVEKNGNVYYADQSQDDTEHWFDDDDDDDDD